MSKAIYKLDWDFGRMGSLEGVFVADSDDIKNLLKDKPEIYFGEVLGKHSEIIGVVKKEHLTKITDDEKFIELFEKYGLENGYNPFDYLNESDDDDDSDEDDDEQE